MLILCKVLSNDAIYSEEPAAISSTEAEYTGKDVILTGNVIVEQNLGKIRANRLVISPSSDSEKKIKFGFLQIDGDVIIEYARGGILHCQQAQIDYSALRAVFLGNLSEPDVVFIDKGRWDERKKITPFSMKVLASKRI
jgi:lipopolysaccharide assembly outer membrane protein LptD (OstA)